MEIILKPWPWYISGPLIGLMVPFLFLVGNKAFGISSNLKHICAIIAPPGVSYFKYNWKKESWNLIFVAGVMIGGYVATNFLSSGDPIILSTHTISDLQSLGIRDFGSFMPLSLFSFDAVFTLRGFIHMIIGGFLVGFGTRYAEGCTSGHAITGLSLMRLSSLIAVVGFFAGGLILVHLIYPLLS